MQRKIFGAACSSGIWMVRTNNVLQNLNKNQSQSKKLRLKGKVNYDVRRMPVDRCPRKLFVGNEVAKEIVAGQE